jgi:hypothetical protein
LDGAFLRVKNFDLYPCLLASPTLETVGLAYAKLPSTFPVCRYISSFAGYCRWGTREGVAAEPEIRNPEIWRNGNLELWILSLDL